MRETKIANDLKALLDSLINGGESSPQAGIPQPGSSSPVVKKPYTIGLGDKGEDVRYIQQLLIGVGITKVTISGKPYDLKDDGDFGKITLEAVKVYQKTHGLVADGIVGQKTLSALSKSNNLGLSDSMLKSMKSNETKQAGPGGTLGLGAIGNNPSQGTGGAGPTTMQKIGDYLKASGKQVVLGNYTNNVTVLGTAGQVGTGLLGVDLPGDIRDITYDVTNWEWSWSHAGQTTIDVIGVLPLVGAVKYIDEAGALLKNSDEAAAALKGVGKGGNRPPNLSPEGAGRNGAFREAKRNSGIPVGEQPKGVTPAVDKRGNRIPGKDYDFGDGKVIRDHSGGHEFPDDPTQNRGPHFNDPDGNHYDY